MTLALTPQSSTGSTRERLDRWGPWLVAALGMALLYVPTFTQLARTIWASDEQGHGPIVLGIACWLIWRRWDLVDDPTLSPPRPGFGWPVLVLGAFLYAFGRSQDILIFEVGSFLLMIAGTVLVLRGGAQLKSIWFALFFMLFMVPLPSPVVDALTQPMKLAVSYIATEVLHFFDLPIARAGVVLHIGPYQLLVADACAGLHTLFTLEALGLLYLNLVRYQSAARNIALAVLIVPISFTANVIRVMVLTLVTYYLGDEAGQGFLHGFAGMVLFMSALLLIIAFDGLLRLSVRTPRASAA